ncbi:MAG: WD40 repeat domain-containing protein, partial [Candidatus Poribacteria bacterium]
CVAFDADERLLVTGSNDSEAILWDFATGAEMRRFPHTRRSSVLAVMLRPDGSRLVTITTGAKPLRIWDVATASPAPFPRDRGGTQTVWANTDGTRAVTVFRDGGAALWDTAEGSLVADIPTSARTSGHLTAEFGVDGDTLAIVGRYGLVIILDAVTGAVRRHFNVGDARPLNPTFTADLRLLAVRAWGEVALWDTTRGEVVATYSGGGEPVTGHVLSPGGGAVAVGTLDGAIRVWNVGDNRPPWVLRANATLHGGYTHLSDDGAILITQDSREMVVWDVPTGEVATAVPTGPHFGSEYPTGRILASADGAYWVAVSAHGDGYLWSANRPRARERVSIPDDALAAITRDGRLVTEFDPAGDDVQPLLARGRSGDRLTARVGALSHDGSTWVRSGRGLDVWRRAPRKP